MTRERRGGRGDKNGQCMRKLMWVLLEFYRSLQQRKNFANRSRIDKVIGLAIVRVAQFLTRVV